MRGRKGEFTWAHFIAMAIAVFFLFIGLHHLGWFFEIGSVKDSLVEQGLKGADSVLITGAKKYEQEEYGAALDQFNKVVNKPDKYEAETVRYAHLGVALSRAGMDDFRNAGLFFGKLAEKIDEGSTKDTITSLQEECSDASGGEELDLECCDLGSFGTAQVNRICPNGAVKSNSDCGFPLP